MVKRIRFRNFGTKFLKRTITVLYVVSCSELPHKISERRPNFFKMGMPNCHSGGAFKRRYSQLLMIPSWRLCFDGCGRIDMDDHGLLLAVRSAVCLL